jgi:hypothetical protein
MDSTRITGGPGFFPDKGNLDKTNKKQANKPPEDSPEEKLQFTGGSDNELSSLLKLPPHKIVTKLNTLLERSFNDPNVQKLLTEFKIPVGSRQAIAFSAFACLKDLLKSKLKLSEEDEKAVLDAIKEEFEETVGDKQETGEERKKKKRERRKKNKPNVNAILTIIEGTFVNLEKKRELRISG